MKIVYRYEIDKTTENVEKLHLLKYEVLKETATGYTLFVYGRGTNHEKKKFSKKNGWACETKEIALKNFIIRKQNQIKILKNKIKDAENSISIAENDNQFMLF